LACIEIEVPAEGRWLRHDSEGGTLNADANITQAASIKPRVMRALADLLYAMRGPHCALGKRRQEMIAVLTSGLHRCAY
jgi:hypothetical protein